MAREASSDEEGLRKGAWTSQEDKKLIDYIQEHGEGVWNTVPEKAGLRRCGKSCRLRWINYLKPDIKRGEFSPEEDQIIIKLHAARGNKWSIMAKHLPGRTDNQIKNYWNTYLKKRLIKQGIDPVTHKPIARCGSPKNSKSKSAKIAHATNHNAVSELPENGNIESPANFLACKKTNSSSSFASRILNKIATRANSVKGLLSASMEGCSTPTPSSTPLGTNHAPDPMVSPSHYLDSFIPNNADNIQGVNPFDIESIPMEMDDQEFGFSEFLEACETKIYNINGGYDSMCDILSQDALSGSIDENISTMEDWSSFLLHQPNDSTSISFTSGDGFYGSNEHWNDM